MDQVRPWCSLLDEILSLIISRLSIGDIRVFRVVCKSWSRTSPPITRSYLPVDFFHSEPPFLLLPSCNKLFHPKYHFSHHMQNYEIPAGYIHASHCGWLLMTLDECHIFFSGPTKKIELPDMAIVCYWPNMTFSSSPTSPDCLVFGVVMDPTSEDEITIYTIKPGEEYWTFDEIYPLPHFELASCNPILFKGQYYCLGKGGSLLIYDPKSSKHRWLGPPNPPIHRKQLTRGYQYYMVESRGKLLMVYTDREGHSVNVYRLDTSKRGLWEKLDNLSDTILFVSPVTSFAVPVMKGSGNKIYFSKFGGDYQLLFYSLATREYHYSDGGPSWKNFDRTKSYSNSTWIRPCHSS